MSYMVTAPLVIIPNSDGRSGDWYGYVDASVPPGLNDERCEQLVKEGMLEKVKDESVDDGKTKPPGVKDVLAQVGEDKTLAQVALDEENARGDDARKTLVEKLQAVIDA